MVSNGAESVLKWCDSLDLLLHEGRMRKRSLLFVIAGATFLVGVVAACWKFASLPSEPPPPLITTANQEPFEHGEPDCRVSASFPGVSVDLTKVVKGKNDYFPSKAFYNGWANRTPLMNKWYGKHLRSMQEAPLPKAYDDETEIYRFLWLRTFHRAVAIKAVRHAYDFEVHYLETDGLGGYEPGKLIVKNKFAMSQTQWCEFMDLLDKADFWHLPTQADRVVGTDGSRWILEGVRENRYHLVDRWTPDSGDFREACLFLLKVTGRDQLIPKDDIY